MPHFLVRPLKIQEPDQRYFYSTAFKIRYEYKKRFWRL